MRARVRRRKAFRKRNHVPWFVGLEDDQSMTVEDIDDDQWTCPNDGSATAPTAKPGGDPT